MLVYKLRHKPTGLFYRSSRYSKESNLSERGEIYHTKPPLGYGRYAEHNGQKLCQGDFEVVSFQLTEVPLLDSSGKMPQKSNELAKKNCIKECPQKDNT